MRRGSQANGYQEVKHVYKRQLPDSGPTPQPTQRIADHDGTDGAWNVEKVMGHRQRGQAPSVPSLSLIHI